MTTVHMLETADAVIAYDVHGPLPTAGGRPPLLMIGRPMDAYEARGVGCRESRFGWANVD